ncbi:hypothetical protein PAMP_020432 [Pampus punctatissimus]
MKKEIRRKESKRREQVIQTQRQSDRKRKTRRKLQAKGVILILTKLYDFHIGSVTESALWS